MIIFRFLHDNFIVISLFAKIGGEFLVYLTLHFLAKLFHFVFVLHPGVPNEKRFLQVHLLIGNVNAPFLISR